MQWYRCAVSRHICSRAYANNVKCMYISVSGHIVDCIEFICSIYVAFEGNTCCWQIFDNSMVNRSCNFFILVICAVYV